MTGSTIIFFLSPLGADLSFVADEVSEAMNMDMFASSFSLMNSALAAAAILGPLFIGWLQEAFGWRATCIALGTLCLSGSLPCVSTFSNFLVNHIQSHHKANDLEVFIYWEASIKLEMNFRL